jgi:hypothetical protein
MSNCAAAVLDGDHMERGFRIADIREAPYRTTADLVDRRRQSAVVGRLLRRPHVRGLIHKVPHNRRWLVNREGAGCGNLELNKQFSVTAASQTCPGRASELPIYGDAGGQSFGCGRPQCGAGNSAGLE